MKVEFFRHNINEDDKQEILKVLGSIFLTTGEWTKKFEEQFSAYAGTRHTVGVTSCTNALELALRYYDIGPGDEVITTPMSFIATANAIVYVGARPVFVDVEEATGNINAALIEAAITPRTKAILVVHLYGQLCDMRAIKSIADCHRLRIIEDAAHCIEGIRDGVRVGELGDMACYSFYATKNITSGEGGAVATKDSRAYEWLIRARQHGMSKEAADQYTKKYEHYDMEFLGFKCNMNNIQAALLIHQLERIEKLLERRHAVARQYDKAFKDNPSLQIPSVLSNTKHARHLYTVWVRPDKRDEYMHRMQAAGVGVAVNFRVIHLMKYYREKYGYQRGDFPVAERIGDSTITIPFYPQLTDEEIEYVSRQLKRLLLKNNDALFYFL